MWRFWGKSANRALSNRLYATEATYQTKPYRLHLFEQGPSTTVTLTRDDALQIYRKMNSIRRMETTANNLYKAKIIRGFCHLYSGQEAVAVGIRSALRPTDLAITSYRNHAWAYLMHNRTSEQQAVLEVLTELVGGKSGTSRGKGGSMHMYTDSLYGGNAIVGAQVPMGVGIALSLKYRNLDSVCFTMYGDGAANNGQVFEAFNMAALYKTPCIFTCENNLYSMGTSLARSAAKYDFYKRSDAVPGIWVDGMDVLASREAAKFAIAHCMANKGPICLEMETYRYSGHSLSDPGTTYRSREEVQKVRESRDPIATIRDKIVAGQLATKEELGKIEQEVKAMVEGCLKMAKKDAKVGVEELTYDIYANCVVNPIRNLTHEKPLEHRNLTKPKNLK